MSTINYLNNFIIRAIYFNLVMLKNCILRNLAYYKGSTAKLGTVH